jgi:hypothetical protein
MPETERLLTELDERVKSGCKVWIFQSRDPKTYKLKNRLEEVDVGDTDVWEINQHEKEIIKGHIALVWSAGERVGIHAIVDVISDPKILVDPEESTKHWTNEEDKRLEKLRVRIEFMLKLGDKYLTKEELKGETDLSNLSILRFWRGTNFPVSKDEWLTISRMIREKFTQ